MLLQPAAQHGVASFNLAASVSENGPSVTIFRIPECEILANRSDAYSVSRNTRYWRSEVMRIPYPGIREMYADAESIDPEHPLEAVAESLNRAMEDTGYTFRAAESENGVAISKDGAEAGTAAVGPSMGDILGIPQQ